MLGHRHSKTDREIYAPLPASGKRFMLAMGYGSFAVQSACIRKRNMNYFLNWQDRVGSQQEKFYKTTLWQGEYASVGLNCLEPGQTQKIHAHDGADKFYLVLEGQGKFTVGDDERQAETGSLVVAPSGVPHGVTNVGDVRLSLLVTIAPPFK
jgi:quercetin dioxygenase-like cupin family protein